MKDKTNNQQRVVVAMSGGVDSSVAAFLLKERGYEVIGISLKLWDYDEAERKNRQKATKMQKTCCSYQDISDAASVCDRLDIPFYAFNYKKHFEEKVIQPFVWEYHQGRTPNPCILCNQHVKFDRLLDESAKLGADFLATGHYARIQKGEDGYDHLLKGVDQAKDQSYVLFGLTQDILGRLLLPIGELTKTEVRTLARKMNLPTADKHESQDICFVPNNDYSRFIEKKDFRFIHPKGDFVDDKGNILGKHEGIHHYTVGQRRGLRVAMGERYYVTRIDAEKNQVILGKREETYQTGCLVSQLRWLNPSFVSTASTAPASSWKPVECDVKIRYQKDEIPAVVEPSDSDNQVRVLFKEKHFGVTPGQAAVFYRDSEVLGGGWINRAL